MIWHPLWLSLQVTVVASVVVLVLGVAFGLWLARARFRGQALVETLLILPLVLPPSVVGFYLLFVFGRGSPIREWFGIDILFTWWAAVAASAIVALPLMVQSVRAAVAGVDPTLENAARTLGASEVEVFFRVTLPLARQGILAGLVLASARALGEFGATLMVAGSIPGRTQTLPLLVYEAVQNYQLELAGLVVAILTGVAFLAILIFRRLETGQREVAALPLTAARAGDERDEL